MKLHNVSIETVLDAVKTQTGVNMLYNSQMFKEKSFQILPPEMVQEEEDGGAVTEQEKVPDESEKEPGIREEQEEEAAAVGTESADTGDSMPVAGWLLLGTIAGIAAVMMKIRQNRTT